MLSTKFPNIGKIIGGRTPSTKCAQIAEVYGPLDTFALCLHSLKQLALFHRLSTGLLGIAFLVGLAPILCACA